MNKHSSSWSRLCLLVAPVALAGCVSTGVGSRDSQGDLAQGEALLAQGQIEPGLARLQQAVQRDPDNTVLRTRLAIARAAALGMLLDAAGQAQQAGQGAQAEAAWRRVLAIDPGNDAARRALAARRAPPPAASTPVPMIQLPLMQLPMTQLAQRFQRKISLAFRDAPLRAVLDVMARETGLNVYLDQEVRPDARATVLVRDASVEDALRLVLATSQLDYRLLSDNAILVYPDTPQKSKDYQDLSVRSFHLTHADPKAVANTIKAIVKTRDLIVDERLGTLFMRDTPEAIALAERIVALQDMGDAEVMLEVEILEVRRSRLLELGLQWPDQLSLQPLQRPGVPLTLRELGQITSATTQAQLGPWTARLNQADGDVNVLANPRIRVRNKERAKVQIGERLPVMTTTSTSTGFLAESVSYVDVGLKLEVEPSVHFDDEVALRVNLEVSSQGTPVTSRSGSIAYQISTRSANTALRLRDGETQVLAGLIQDNERRAGSHIPLLGKIPLLGRLFGSQRDNNERTEILLSITPRILRAPQQPSLSASLFASGTESRVGIRSLALSTATDLTPDVAASVAWVAPPAPTTSTAALAAAPTKPVDDVPGLALQWQVPNRQLKVGQTVSVVLQIAGAEALRDIEARIGYDPQVLKVVGVHEGDFFARGRAPTRFVPRVAAAQGRLFLQVERPDEDGVHGAASGAGDLAVVSFQALRPASASSILLLGARAEPQPTDAIRPASPLVLEIVP